MRSRRWKKPARKLHSCLRSSTAARVRPNSTPRPEFPSRRCSVPRNFSRWLEPTLAAAQQAVTDLLELFERRIADAKLALLAFAFADLDLKPERLAQFRLGGARVGVLALLTFGFGGTTILRERLDLTHVQSAAHDA